MTTLNYESCQISGMNRENYFKSGSYDIQIFIRYVFFSLNVVGKWRQLENRVMQNIQYCVRCDATKTLNVSLLSSSLLTASSWSVINDRYFIYLFMPSNRLFVCICHKQPNGEVVLFFYLYMLLRIKTPEGDPFRQHQFGMSLPSSKSHLFFIFCKTSTVPLLEYIRIGKNEISNQQYVALPVTCTILYSNCAWPLGNFDHVTIRGIFS